MTTTSTTNRPATTEPRVGSSEWLLLAAARLDERGEHAFAAEARAEAATADQPRPAPVTVAVRCDGCQRPVGDRRAAQYAALGVDWALCARCARS